MKRLVILVNAFPFGNWEPFLMAELPFLNGFDSIDIMSLSVREDQVPTRRLLPPGPFTVSMISFRRKWFYAVNAWRELFDGQFYRELTVLKQSGRLSCRNLVTLLVFLTRARYEARKVLIYLNKLGAMPDDRVVFYSYRMAYQPYIAGLVRRCFPHSVSVARAHRADLYEEHSPRKYLPLRKQTVDLLDRIYCISEHGEEYLRRQLPQSAEKTVISRLGTIDQGVAYLSPSRADGLRIVTCSTLTPVKRLHLFIQALALVDFPVQWEHYGEGPLLEEMQELARLSLGPIIKAHFKGFVPNEQVVRRYVEDPVHLLVNTSESEGVPVSVMEALSTGTPVVATNVGGTSEIVKSEVNGFLLPHDATPRTIADTLAQVHRLSDTDYDSLRWGARSSWEQYSKASVCFSKFASELDSVLS